MPCMHDYYTGKHISHIEIVHVCIIVDYYIVIFKHIKILLNL